MVGYALGNLVNDGKVVADSRVDFVRSPVAMAVRSGAPKPDIKTVKSFRKVLLEAKSVAYSDSASCVHVKTEMFKKLGIDAEMQPKSRMIPAMPVGEIVAQGNAELGFQQLSELLSVHASMWPGRCGAADHHFLGRHLGFCQGSRGWQGAHRLPDGARKPARHHQDGVRSDPTGAEEIIRQSSAGSVDVACWIVNRGNLDFAREVALQAARLGDRKGGDGHKFLQDRVRQLEPGTHCRLLGIGADRNRNA